MQRARLRRAALCFLAVAAAPLLLPYAGGASEPARQGWWWQANPGQGAPSPPPPPDVPADGLYVQGGPNGPVALGAVAFDLAEGETPKTLILHLVPPSQAVSSNSPAPLPTSGTPAPAPSPDSAPTPPPAIQACSIAAGTFNVEQGGPIADAPTADCTTPVAGTVDATAGTVTFDLSTLKATSGSFAVAIEGVGPTDRASFQKPGADALMVEASPSTDSSLSSSTATDSSSATATSGTPASSSVASSAGTSDLPTSSGSLGYVPGAASTGAPSVAAAPAPATAPATGLSGSAAAPANPRRTIRPAALAASRNDTASRVGEMAALALVVAALLSYSRGYGLLGGKFAES